MESHGRDRDDGFRNPPVTEVNPDRSRAEARRRPPRVRSLMEIVGSNEQMARVGFSFASRISPGQEHQRTERALMYMRKYALILSG